MAYKDSGIEWIGEIPENWSIVQIGSLYFERNKHVSALDFEPLSVTKKGVVPQLDTAAKSDNPNDRKLVKINDFAINSRSDRRGSCGISQYDGSVSLINTVLVPLRSDLISNKFYEYVFHTSMFADEFYRWGHGIVDDLWTTKWQEMKKIGLPFPSYEEQNKISSFLDRKTNRANALIDNLNNQIDKLKEYKKALITKCVTKGLDPNVSLKDSGTDWIGEIPEQWFLVKIKDTSWLKGRIGWQGLKSTEFITEGPYLITGTDFADGYINWDSCVHISKERFEEAPEIHIKEDDLLITKDGTIGKVAIAKNCPHEVSLNSGVLLIRNVGNFKYFDKFLYYVLLSNEFVVWYENSQTGNSTIRHLYQEQFYNFQFAYPPIDEQEEIASYLDKKCSIIDSLISSKQQQIDKLNEYQKSLIYEYVTGKKEVV